MRVTICGYVVIYVLSLTEPFLCFKSLPGLATVGLTDAARGLGAGGPSIGAPCLTQNRATLLPLVQEGLCRPGPVA